MRLSATPFIAGDWGTSHLRLYLCDAAGGALESVTGPGAAAASGRFPEVFAELTAPWRERQGVLPAVLCGMVGSNIGWLQAPYVDCPAPPERIGSACVSPPGLPVHIVPGLACTNRFKAPDFMRGEETQILGAMQLNEALRKGRQLLCLPGTHTKWVMLEDGAVQEFTTAPTGELFAILRDHSVLVRSGANGAAALTSAAFEQGLDQFNDHPGAQLLHRLFECRSRQLAGELAPEASAAFLSGLLIACDISGALQLLPPVVGATVCLIGAPPLTALYAIGLEKRNCDSQQVDGASASLAGLSFVHHRLQTGVSASATH
jgi:2-dehydro-3-deoxygalactonokinase